MHELSLVSELLRQVEEVMHAHHAERVVAVRVFVGELSGTEPELLSNAFELVAETTSARGARLELQFRPLMGQCQTCQRQFRVERFRFQCPFCAARKVSIVDGQDVILDSVTLETDEGSQP